jgi:hypothetical protein
MKTPERVTEEPVMQENSPEEIAASYLAQIKELERDLEHLTFLEHPIQIQRICWKIKAIKISYNQLVEKMRLRK